MEVRWRERLQEVTELSLAHHAADPDGHGTWPAQRAAQRLLRRTVAARRGLADVEEALGRLAAGNFGYCGQCGSALPPAPARSLPRNPVLPALRRRGSTGNGPPAGS